MGSMAEQPSGVNQVSKDGRIKLPPDIAEKYAQDYLAIYDRNGGQIEMKVVNGDESC